MQKTTLILPEVKVVGLKTRTNNKAEMDPSKAKIASTLHSYFGNALREQITHRKNPGTIYCIYTEYESDFTGEYTYFVGEAVSSFDVIPEGFSKLIIPSWHYIKFTNGPEKMPQVCIEIWQKIWQMTPQELGAKRAYLADFEIYDERAQDPEKTILDVYLGIL